MSKKKNNLIGKPWPSYEQYKKETADLIAHIIEPQQKEMTDLRKDFIAYIVRAEKDRSEIKAHLTNHVTDTNKRITEASKRITDTHKRITEASKQTNKRFDKVNEKLDKILRHFK